MQIQSSLVQVLLSRTSFFDTKLSSKAENVGLQRYKETADAIMCGLLPDSPTATTSRTSGKFDSLWINFHSETSESDTHHELMN